MLYHLDRGGTLKPGMILQTKPPSEDSEISSQDRKALIPLDEIFPYGVSKFGSRYFQTVPSKLFDGYSFFPEELEGDVSIALMEQTFELVRRADFPDMPSRFTSLFCVSDLTWFAKWPRLTETPGHVFEIKPIENNKTATLDASFLKGDLTLKSTKDGGINVRSSFHLNVSYAYRYWSGEFSDNPQEETLVELPVTVGRVLLPKELPESFWPQNSQ